MKLRLVKCEALGDWYIIERANHDGRTWLEPTGPGSSRLMTSARFSDADVEGDTIHMRGIAEAIRERGEYSAKRCAVTIVGNEARFCSPRNSQQDGVVSLDDADDLATQIEQTLGP